MIRRALEALKKNRARLGWAAAEGAIGAAIGILGVAMYLASR